MLVNITYGHNHVSTGNKPYKVKIPIYNTSKDKVSVVLSSAHWSSSQDVSWCGSVGKKVTQRIYWQKQKETQTAVYKEYPNGWIPMGKGMWSGGGGGGRTQNKDLLGCTSLQSALLFSLPQQIMKSCAKVKVSRYIAMGQFILVFVAKLQLNVA